MEAFLCDSCPRQTRLYDTEIELVTIVLPACFQLLEERSLSHVDPNPQDATDLEAMAAKLEATGTYRVLRKLGPRSLREPPPGVATRQGLFVDTETTGLDPARDEIIELAMVPFTYSLDGQIYAVGEPFQQLRGAMRPRRCARP